MHHIPMTKAVQIRRALEAGNSVEEVAQHFGLPVERVEGFAPKKAAAKKPAAKKKVAPKKKAEETPVDDVLDV